MSSSGYESNGDPDVEWWTGQIRKGIEYRKKKAYQQKWETWQKFYRGEWDSGVMPTNLFFKMVRTMVPRVYFRDPTVSITQTKPGDDFAVFSQILERVDNKLLRKLKLKQQMKLAIQDGFMCGTGIIKLGFGAEYTPTPDSLSTSAPVGKKQDAVEYNSLVEPNMPWAQRVHPKHFIVPDRCTSLEQARWVAHEIHMNLNDLKDDPRFKHTAGIDPNRPLPGTQVTTQSDLPDNTVIVYEVRDKKKGKVFVIAPNYSKKVLVQGPDKYLQATNRFPFFPIVFNNPDYCFWGIPDAQILDPQQREANETRTLIMKHRRMSIVKLLFKRGTITPDEIEKMTGEGVAMGVEVSELGSVEPITVVNGIPTGLIESLNLAQQEAQEIVGLGVNQFGEYAPGSADRSATEAQIVNQATQIRIDERRDQVADTVTDIVEGMHTIIFQFWSQDQVVDIVGDDGAQVWVTFTPEMLKDGTYDINIDPDSGLPETAALRKQEAMQLYPVLMQNPFVSKMRVTQNFLRELRGIQYDHLLLTPQEIQQQSEQQEQQQAEQFKMQLALIAAKKPQPKGPQTTSQFAANNPRTMAVRQGQMQAANAA